MSIIGWIIGLLLAAIVSGFVIWVVGKLGLGIEVDGFRPAYLAAIVIAVLSAVIVWIWQTVFKYTLPGGLEGALISLVTSAAVLQTAGRWVKGLRVKGFLGALIGAVAISAVGWLLAWLVSTLVA